MTLTLHNQICEANPQITVLALRNVELKHKHVLECEAFHYPEFEENATESTKLVYITVTGEAM